MFRSSLAAAVLIISGGIGTVAYAQQLGYSNPIVIPVVAETASYSSTIFVHNAYDSDGSVVVFYVGARNSATPGTTVCAGLPVPAGVVVKTSLGELCPALNPGSNFGALTLHNFPVAAYARVQAPSGNGFSVEGFVGNACCGAVRDVLGLVRQAAAPTYQSNCFLVNQDPRGGRIVVTLATGTGELIAAQIVDLQSDEVIRLLDVFATLGAPPGDYDNVRATFESITPLGGGSPVSFVAACTVQNNTTFDADFRIAKSHN